MNYVPGTASLIDDIDSKSERRVRSLEHSDSLVGNRFQDVASCVSHKRDHL